MVALNMGNNNMMLAFKLLSFFLVGLLPIFFSFTHGCSRYVMNCELVFFVWVLAWVFKPNGLGLAFAWVF